jgi:hypothetical protein
MNRQPDFLIVPLKAAMRVNPLLPRSKLRFTLSPTRAGEKLGLRLATVLGSCPYKRKIEYAACQFFASALPP